MIGRTLSHYRIEAPLGQGGMGVVYRARDLHLERNVALKVLPEGALAGAPGRKRFHREALALSQLNHPHIDRQAPKPGALSSRQGRFEAGSSHRDSGASGR